MEKATKMQYLINKINAMRCSGADKKRCFVALQKVSRTDKTSIMQDTVTSDYIDEQISKIGGQK